MKFSLDRILDPAAGAALEPAGRHGDGGRRGHRQVEKPSPDATLLAVLAMPEAAIVSRKWVESGANLKLSANGTGPFVLRAAVRASLVRNPAYFVDAQPYLDGVDFRMIKSDDARVNALRSQSLDMIDFVPWKDIDALRRNAGMKVDMPAALHERLVQHRQKPFDDARVRRAPCPTPSTARPCPRPLSSATASPSMARRRRPIRPTTRTWTAPGAACARAGHPNGVDASMVVFQGLGIYTTMAQVIQANLKEAGINLKLEPVEWATLVERRTAATMNR